MDPGNKGSYIAKYSKIKNPWSTNSNNNQFINYYIITDDEEKDEEPSRKQATDEVQHPIINILWRVPPAPPVKLPTNNRVKPKSYDRISETGSEMWIAPSLRYYLR